MRAVGIDETAHAHLGCTVEERLGDLAIGASDIVERPSNGENTVMNTLNDLADSSADLGLLAEICNIPALLSNYDTGLLGRDDGTHGQGLCGILLFCALWHILAGWTAVHVETAHAWDNVGDVKGVCSWGGCGFCFDGHDGWWCGIGD